MPVVSGIISRLGSEVIQPAAQVLMAAAFLYFIWGLVKFLWNAEEGGKNDDGKRHMIWGIVGMFIMISVWSIITLLDNTFNLGATNGNGAASDINRNQIQAVQFNPNP